MPEKTYTVTNRVIFREYEIPNWEILPNDVLQHFAGFSILFVPEENCLKITLVLDTDNDDRIDQEFQDFLHGNGFVEIS